MYSHSLICEITKILNLKYMIAHDNIIFVCSQCTDADNILILSFEQMKKDSKAAVKSVADYLGYQLSEDIIQKIVDQTQFSVMKLNPAANNGWMAEYHT